jgi:hypothetical protein
MIGEMARLDMKQRKLFDGDISANISWVNDRAVKGGWPSDAGIYIASGNCCAPMVADRDYLMVSSEVAPVHDDSYLPSEKGQLVSILPRKGR